MGLNLSNVNHQRPYLVKDGKNTVKQKQEEEKTAQTEREQEQHQDGKSKGLALVEDKPKTFVPNYTAQVQQQSWQATRNQIQAQPKYSAQTNTTQAVSGDTFEYQGVSANINIAQVLKDFRNTALAIGTPPELQAEVDGYLELINSQVTKEKPNTKLIKSNLKNASSLLDAYISETLNKDSKVVENWVDAIFLQQIDFKYNENEINPQFLVKFPEKTLNKNTEEEATSASAEPKTAQTQSIPPQAPQIDNELKNMFKYSKQLARENNPKAALLNFQKALNRADELGETSIKSKIYLEVGDIYNEYNYLPQALTSYNKSLENATENSVKIKAHYSMAQIYDNVNQVSPALDHYYTTVAYAGEEDNLVAQSVSLTKMGNIYSDMYEQEALDFLTNAKELAAQTENAKVKGFVASSRANGLSKFGEPQEALKEYSQAVKFYSDADSPLKIAQNYNSAADLMLEYHNINKAKKLLTKGLVFANQTNDLELVAEMSGKLEILS